MKRSMFSDASRSAASTKRDCSGVSVFAFSLSRAQYSRICVRSSIAVEP